MVMPKAFLFVVVGYVIEVPALVRVNGSLSSLVETREKCILFSETKNHGGPLIDKHKIYISE
jgi:hypothetical protein